MIYIAIGFLLLGLLIGGSGFRAAGRMARRAWKPGAGMMALSALLAAAVMAVMERFLPAGLLGLVGLGLAVGTRWPRRPGAMPPQPPAISMDLQAACSILGVAADATDDEVQAAYLRLIRRTHPDQGGSAGLAAQLNAARDTMMRRRR